MGVDTKGIVDLRNTILNPFETYDHIYKAIMCMFNECPEIIAKRKEGYAMPWHRINQEAKEAGKEQIFRMPSASMSNLFELFTVHFTYLGENRNLSVNFGCHNDYKELFVGRRLILSFGSWGHSVEIMERILKTLGEALGFKTYLIPDDCAEDAVESATVVTEAKDFGTEGATLVRLADYNPNTGALEPIDKVSEEPKGTDAETKAVHGIVDSLLNGSPNESAERTITKVGKTKRKGKTITSGFAIATTFRKGK